MLRNQAGTQDFSKTDTQANILSYGEFCKAVMQLQEIDEAKVMESCLKARVRDHVNEKDRAGCGIKFFEKEDEVVMFAAAFGILDQEYERLTRTDDKDLLRHRLRLVNFRLLELIEFLDVGAYAGGIADALFSEQVKERLEAERAWEFKTFKLKVPPIEPDSWRLGMEQKDLESVSEFLQKMFDRDSVSSTPLLVPTNVTPRLVPRVLLFAQSPTPQQSPTPRPQKETPKVGEEHASRLPSPETVEPTPEIQSTTSVSSEAADTNSTPSADAESQEDLQEPAWLPTSTV
jgi:hypothetical protein